MAVLADAFDIQEGAITTTVPGSTPLVHGYITELTINNNRPEDFINVIGGQVRRRKPEEVSWTIQACVLYDNLVTLQTLMNTKFEIYMQMTNPETGAGQKITLFGCRIADNSTNINDSSTLTLSGRADSWLVDVVTA